MPSLVSTEQLPRSNALLVTSEQATRVVGPVLGGSLLTFLGITETLAFNVITFAVATASLLAARIAVPLTEAPAGQAGKAISGTGLVRVTCLRLRSVITEIAHGIVYAGRAPATRAVLLMVTAATVTYNGLFGVRFRDGVNPGSRNSPGPAEQRPP